MRPALTLLAALLGLLALTPPALAVSVDGRLDSDYGTPLVVQVSQTNLPDNTTSYLGPGNGGELDAAYAYVAGDALHLFVAGNLWCEGNGAEYGLHFSALHLFFDTGGGGQNAVSGFTGYHVAPPNGLAFDAGFSPAYWLACAGSLANYYDPASAYTLYAWSSPLPAPAGGVVNPLGSTGAGGPGTLTGGTNPDGIRVAIDNRNTGGVAHGCAASSGDGATTGIEWAIPLAAIGNPAGCFKVSAVLTWSGSYVTDQVLGPVPAGTCTMDPTPNFASIPGNQFFQVCPEGVPVRRATWGALKSTYR